MKEKRSEENTAALPHEYAAPEIVLLLRARSGDEQAFAQLVAGYARCSALPWHNTEAR